MAGYQRRRTYRRKPSYRRRPIYKKRMMKRRRTFKRSQYDTNKLVTCDVSKPMEYRTDWIAGDTTQGRFLVSWGSDTNGGTDAIAM